MAKTLFADTESQASGTPLSTSNSVFNAFLGTPTFDNAHAMHGSNSLKFGGTSGAASYGAKTGISSTSFNMWAYEYFTSAPATDTYLGRFLVGSTRILSAHLNAAGKLRVSDSAGTTGVTGWSSNGTATAAAAVIPLNQFWRWELYGHIGATGTTGDIQFAYFLGDSTTPIETLTISGTANLGTAAVTVLNKGKSDTGTYASPFWTDDAGYDLAATGLPGPYVVGTPATVTAVTATATASAPAPAVSADTIVTGGGAATATAAAPAPTVTAGATVSAPRATGTAAASVPAVTAGVSITAPAATGTAAANAPAVLTGATVSAATATGIGSAPAPTVSAGGSATVSAPAAAAVGAAPAPDIRAGATVAGVAATGSAAARVPFLSIGATITAPAAVATARAWAPSVGGRLPRDITVTVTGPYGNPFRDSTPQRNPLRVTGVTR